MSQNSVGGRIKTMRIKKGFSQELLAEDAGIGLRTVQRIESGQAEPRGDTLKRIAGALGLTPDDLLDWSTYEDRGFLATMHLSALGFLVFPVVGIIIPLILWLSKRDAVSGANGVGKSIVNFQITWNLLFFSGLILGGVLMYNSIMVQGDVSAAVVRTGLTFNWTFIIAMYVFNIVLIAVNTSRSLKGKKPVYFPALPLMR